MRRIAKGGDYACACGSPMRPDGKIFDIHAATGNPEPPSGLPEPKYGIGRVWLRELGGPKSSIGWAKTEATDVTVWRDQLFHNGFVLETPTHLYLFFNNQAFQAVQK